MKKVIRQIIILVLLTALLLPCFVFADTEKKAAKVGVLLGGILDAFCDDAIPGSEPEYFYAAADMPLALEAGKIDAYIDDELSAIAHCNTYKNIRIDKVVYSDHYGYIFNKKNEALCNQMSEFIISLRENGTLDEYKKIWVDGDDESLKVVDYSGITGENGKLSIAIAATMPPMVYVKDGEYAGYEVAILMDFCRQYGYSFDFSNTNFSSVLAGVTSGIYDIGAASFSITDERKKSMLFSESHVQANAVSVVRKNEASDGLTLADFTSARIGMLPGSIHIDTAKKVFSDAILSYYDTNTATAEALEKNKIDAYITDAPSAEALINIYDNQTILSTLDYFSYAFALPKDDPGSELLKEQLDNFLYKIKENGELKAIHNIWFGQDESVKTVDLERLQKNSKKITLAAFPSDGDPFVCKQGDSYGGYEIDIIARFCDEYGYDLDINEYSFDGLLLALENNKCDVAAGAIAITNERAEKFDFSVSNYDSSNVLVIKDINAPIEENSFFAGVKDSFYKTFIKENRWKLFVQGIITTVSISVLSIILGTIIAYLFNLLYFKKKTIINRVINAFCEVFEKTPAVVILMILYYLIFGKIDINAAVVATIGLSFKFSVRVFGLFKIGVGAINVGQTEAALALSYTEHQTFKKIVFPQAVMHIIDGYKSGVVGLIEQSAVVGYIAVQDLTKVSDIIRSRTYEAFFPLVVSALIYIVIAVLLIALVKQIEIKINPRNRDESDILKGIKR